MQDNPNDAKNLYAMANLYEKFGKVTRRSRPTRRSPSRTRTTPRPAARWPASTTSRSGTKRRGLVENQRRARARQVRPGDRDRSSGAPTLDPNDPSGYQKVAIFYWARPTATRCSTDEQKDAYADKGLEAVDKALAA